MALCAIGPPAKWQSGKPGTMLEHLAQGPVYRWGGEGQRGQGASPRPGSRAWNPGREPHAPRPRCAFWKAVSPVSTLEKAQGRMEPLGE